MCYPAEFGRSRSNDTSVIKQIRLKNLIHRVPLLKVLKVIGTHRDRSAICDFLLTFHSNRGPISHRFRDKRRFQSKITNFSNSSCTITCRCFESKTRMTGLPGRERNLTISSAVWIQYRNVTDGRTDTGRQQRPLLRIASRGKNSSQSSPHSSPQRANNTIKLTQSSKIAAATGRCSTEADQRAHCMAAQQSE